MGAKEEYEARKEAREARQAEQEKAKQKHPWWFWNPDPVAKFTGWVAIYTGLLFLATVISAAILYKTDETLHHTLVASQRPWLSFKAAIAGPLVFDEADGFSINIRLTVKNTGRSPASSVYEYGAFTAAADASAYSPSQRQRASGLASEIQTTVCQWNLPLSLRQGQGAIVFPDESRTTEIKIRVHAMYVRDFNVKLEELRDVVVCVAYDTGYERNRFGYIDGQFTSQWLLIERPRGLGVPIPADQMTLRETGSFAGRFPD